MTSRVEGFARRVRHSRLLGSSAALWKIVRPAYDLLLVLLYGRRGLGRMINGTEPMLISPHCRRSVTLDEHEPAVLALLLESISEGDVVADVGANLGVYSIALARRGAKVVAFEPEPQTAVFLRQHVRWNEVSDSVSIRELAIGAKLGMQRFLPSGTANVESRISSTGPLMVSVSTLDDEFAEERVDVIKVDVEGHEVAALEGAQNLLKDHSRRPNLLLIEVHDYLLHPVGLRADDVRDLLPGYEIQELSNDGERRHWLARLHNP